ncbi:unnamed protein product [Phytophthora fragariaefolia]|uniref:Unnamed protein product n=1 Tax=Phytophthora fragariaefolia TaxID=1490495 RepID=A0A9W6XIN8_9STRA|nr:unnamed protein product [Phytophthora fragariaefolia]
MIFAVNFSTQQSDHFLPSSISVSHIKSIKDLRLALSHIEETAKDWHPRTVAAVFSCVYSNSLSELLYHVTRNLVHATINLYTHAFTALFQSIRDGLPAASLVPPAQAIMMRGSPEYERLVRHVIDEGLIATWARNQSSQNSPRSDRDPRPRSWHQSSTDHHASSTVPPAIRAHIPVVNGSQVIFASKLLRAATSLDAITSTILHGCQQRSLNT